MTTKQTVENWKNEGKSDEYIILILSARIEQYRRVLTKVVDKYGKKGLKFKSDKKDVFFEI